MGWWRGENNHLVSSVTVLEASQRELIGAQGLHLTTQKASSTLHYRHKFYFTDGHQH